LWLRQLALNVRLRPVAELDVNPTSVTSAVGSDSSQRAFLALLEDVGFRRGSIRDAASAVRLQVWLGNQLSKVEVHSGPERGYDLLRYGMQGGGLACGSVADILREALVILGVPARAVELSQSDFRQRTHAVVEAHLGGEWRVLDPTFNATYDGPAGVLGVAAIQRALSSAGVSAVRIVWHGPRRYPADFDRHAGEWPLYFANAYVYETGVLTARWRQLPPWRYWTGPARYYYGDRLMALPLIQDRLYWGVTFLLPVSALTTGLLAVAFGLAASRRPDHASTAGLPSEPPIRGPTRSAAAARTVR
jgi:hypothetical protein